MDVLFLEDSERKADIFYRMGGEIVAFELHDNEKPEEYTSASLTP